MVLLFSKSNGALKALELTNWFDPNLFLILELAYQKIYNGKEIELQKRYWQLLEKVEIEGVDLERIIKKLRKMCAKVDCL